MITNLITLSVFKTQASHDEPETKAWHTILGTRVYTLEQMPKFFYFVYVKW